jgi:hypothetical protein
MGAINSTTLYPLVTPTGADTVLISDASDSNATKQATIASIATASQAPSAFVYEIDLGSTADSDPGNGLLKFNHATPSSATFLYIDDAEANLIDLSTLYGGFPAIGWVLLFSRLDSAVWMAFKWSAVTDGTGYFKFAVVHQASIGSFVDGDDVLVSFHPGNAVTSGTLAQFAATTSAQLAGVISDETGSGALVFATSPTLVTPALGTPSALVLTNATGLPVAGGGTGVATLTAYAPVFGGTTGTGAVQSGTVGSAGQVLTSNGAGALPTFQAAASGSVATDTMWDAGGDLVQGTGSNTAARLALGTAGQVLKVNAGATAVEWGAGAGDVATDAIWDTAGDLVQATGANTAAKLPIGTAGQVLTVNAGATAAEWATASGGSTQGKHAVYIDAAAMRPNATTPCDVLTLSNPGGAVTTPNFSFLAFDSTSAEYANFHFVAPKKWDEGTVTFRLHWAHETTATNFGVVFNLRASAASDGDANTTAFGTPQSVTDTGGSATVHYTSPESAAITIAGTPAAEDILYFQVYRSPTDGSDTLDVDARLVGVTVYMTTNADTDA